MPNIINDIKLDFKDVLLRPKRSTLKSRSDVSPLRITTVLNLVHWNPSFISTQITLITLRTKFSTCNILRTSLSISRAWNNRCNFLTTQIMQFFSTKNQLTNCRLLITFTFKVLVVAEVSYPFVIFKIYISVFRYLIRKTSVS